MAEIAPPHPSSAMQEWKEISDKAILAELVCNSNAAPFPVLRVMLVKAVEENTKGTSLNGGERSAVMTGDDVKERLKKEVLAHSRENSDVSESKGDV